jgi:integrase
MGTRAKGTGSIFRDKKSRFYWIAYMSGGKRRYESTRSTRKRDAQNLLTARLGDVQRGLPVTPDVGKVTFDAAAEDLLNDYRTNGKRSLAVVARRIGKHLRPFFNGLRRMASISTPDVRTYILQRQTANSVLVHRARTVVLPDGTEQQLLEERRPASDAEINRELALLKRMFNLAIQAGKLLHKPYVPMLREDNVRTGFFEPDMLASVLSRLPEPIRPVIRFAAITGWRIQSEVLPLEWRQVDFPAGEVRLDAGTTKNREGRVFPMTAELRALLEGQRAEHERLKSDGRIVRFVFHRGGERIISLLKSWHAACAAAGCPGRIPHDLRRTAVRNLVRAGITERVAMKMTGHKTPSVFQRYNIVSDGDLREAARKLDGAASALPRAKSH